MRRAFYLYRMWWLTLGHRLRHDLGRELSILTASCVMFATFFYVFNDFLNVQVAEIALNMRHAFARTLAIVVLLICTAAGAFYVRKQAARSVMQMAAQLGESDNTLRTYRYLHAGTLLSAWHGGAWYLILRWLEPWPVLSLVVAEGGMLIITFILPEISKSQEGQGLEPKTKQRQVARAQTKISVLTQWRLQQILSRSRLSRIFLALSVGFLTLVALAAARSAPPFVAATAGLAAGYCTAATLCVQMASDLKHAWLERGVGVTHDEFIRAYHYTGGILGLLVGCSVAIAYLVGIGAGSVSPTMEATILTAAKVLAVAAVPAVTAPCLLLQIDGRRLAVNLLLILIVSLFIGTAVFAHWLGVLLIPLLIGAAGPSQAGRFYRA
ncbi:MAG: hypothetical protein NTY08_12470 [Proteobacteria bacterium]|nr:hypothetical protein [Pseudomonadota bacterium]